MTVITPSASVFSWNSKRITLCCPYCEELEVQPFQGYESYLLPARCDSGNYHIVFPPNGNWEIDKIAGEYIDPRLRRSGSRDLTQFDALLIRSGHPTIGASVNKNIEQSIGSISVDESTNRVIEIARVIRYRLTANHRKDGRKPGQSSASHPEKRLIVKFLDDHIWLPDEGEVDRELKEEIKQLTMKAWWVQSSSAAVKRLEGLEEELKMLPASDAKDKTTTLHNQILELKEHSTDVQRYEKLRAELETKQDELNRQQMLHDLKAITPPNGLTEATIEIVSDGYVVCDDCKRFTDTVNRAFGTKIEIHELHHMVEPQARL